MLQYAVNRILYLIPVLFILSVVVFSFVHFLPGDVIDVMVGQEGIVDPEVRRAMEKEYGLDKPLYVQYLVWLNRVLHGNFGNVPGDAAPYWHGILPTHSCYYLPGSCRDGGVIAHCHPAWRALGGETEYPR